MMNTEKETISEESARFKQQFKRALIIFAFVEFIAVAFVVYHVVQTGRF